MANGFKILESAQSPINGLVVVEEGSGPTRRISANGIIQSGEVVGRVWDKSFKLMKSIKQDVSGCLVLGLAGGTITKKVVEYWPNATITGVDIDPLIVGFGQKYLDLNSIKFNLVIEDAYSFTKREINKESYDLVLFDIFIRNKVPEIFSKETYVKDIHKLVNKDGLIAFNRLFVKGYHQKTKAFHDILKHYFTKVIPVFGKANVIFVCKTS